MNLLKSLGITEYDLEKYQEEQRRKEAQATEHFAEWKPWLEKHESTVTGYNTWLDMQEMLKNISEENLLIIKPLKKNLNEVIQFSSSRHNEFKKSDYVRMCFDAIKNATISQPIHSVIETTTGCFSSGAHGHGGKKGSSIFNAKFTNSGTYRMEIPFGQPYLILDNCKLVVFEGFDYDAEVVIEQNILDKYKEYKSGKSQHDDEF